MPFRELQAMQVAYELLSPLDPNARQRVMTWLSAALADTDGISATVGETADAGRAVAEGPVEVTPSDSRAHALAEHEAPASIDETAAPTVRAAELAAAAEPGVTAESKPEPVAESTPDPVPRRSRAATGRRAAKAARSPGAAKPAESAPGPRSDRPGGDQFLADLAAAGSFKALAGKYGKSIGTIGNWANQLREQGFNIPVGRQKKA
ncbi:hypothetical protein [Actinoplanes sp. NPDC020271]|uniref:hypothetical protein n=1 Tax=Actinoplanes sp. NPDC020271 TaxID=3363896 RepID=UPI00378EFB03